MKFSMVESAKKKIAFVPVKMHSGKLIWLKSYVVYTRYALDPPHEMIDYQIMKTIKYTMAEYTKRALSGKRTLEIGATAKGKVTLFFR